MGGHARDTEVEAAGARERARAVPATSRSRAASDASSSEVVATVLLARVTPKTLVATVRSAEDLVQTDDFGGENDVYAVLHVFSPSVPDGERVWRSSTCYDSLCPEWAVGGDSESGSESSGSESSGSDGEGGDDEGGACDSAEDEEDYESSTNSDLSKDAGENGGEQGNGAPDPWAHALLPVEIEQAWVSIALWSSESAEGRSDEFLGEVRFACARPRDGKVVPGFVEMELGNGDEEEEQQEQGRAGPAAQASAPPAAAGGGEGAGAPREQADASEQEPQQELQKGASKGPQQDESADEDGKSADGADGAIFLTELPLEGHQLTLPLQRLPAARCAAADMGYVGGNVCVELRLEQESPDRNVIREIGALRHAAAPHRCRARELGIRLVQCDGLAMVDPRSARNPDPFCRLFWRGVGGEERLVRETPAVMNTTDPRWPCEVLRLTLPLQLREAALRIEVWDVDKGRLVCLGEAELEGEELLDLRLRKETELQLHPQRALVKLVQAEAEAGAGAGGDEGDGSTGEKDAASEAGEGAEARRRLAEQRRYVCGTVRLHRCEFAPAQIRVTRALDLADTDTGAESGASVQSTARTIVRFNDRELGRTAAVLNDQVAHAVKWCEFDEVVPFHVPLQVGAEPKLVVEVWDWTEGASADADACFLGELSFAPDGAFVLPEPPVLPGSAAEAEAGAELEALELQKKNNTLKYSKFVTGSLAVAKARAPELTVLLCDAVGLRPPSAPDSFVVAHWKGREVYRSAVGACQRGSYRPYWPHEPFTIVLPDARDEPSRVAALTLRLELWARDAYAGDDFLGESEVRVSDLAAGPSARHALRLLPKAGVSADLQMNVGGTLFVAWGEAVAPQKSHHEERCEFRAAEAARRAAEAGEGGDGFDMLPPHWRYNAKQSALWCAAVFQERCAQALLLARHDTERRDQEAATQLLLPQHERERVNREEAQERRAMGRRPRHLRRWRERLRLPALEWWQEKWAPRPDGKIDRGANTGRTKPLTDLTRVEVGEMLRALRMDEYVEDWQAMEPPMDGAALAQMDNRKLEAAGMLLKPHRKTLLGLLSLWRSKGVPLRVLGVYVEAQEEVVALLPAHQAITLTYLAVLPQDFDAEAALAIAGPALERALYQRAMAYMVMLFFWVWKRKTRTGIERWRRKTARLAETRAAMLEEEKAREAAAKEAAEAEAAEQARKVQEAMDASSGGRVGMRMSFKRRKNKGHGSGGEGKDSVGDGDGGRGPFGGGLFGRRRLPPLPRVEAGAAGLTDRQRVGRAGLGAGALADQIGQDVVRAAAQPHPKRPWWRLGRGAADPAPGTVAFAKAGVGGRRSSQEAFELRHRRFSVVRKTKDEKRAARVARKKDEQLRRDAERKYAEVKKRDRERKERERIELRKQGLMFMAQKDIVHRPGVFDQEAYKPHAQRHGRPFVDMMAEVEKLRGAHSGFNEGEQQKNKERQRQQNQYRKAKEGRAWKGASINNAPFVKNERLRLHREGESPGLALLRLGVGSEDVDEDEGVAGAGGRRASVMTEPEDSFAHFLKSMKKDEKKAKAAARRAAKKRRAARKKRNAALGIDPDGDVDGGIGHHHHHHHHRHPNAKQRRLLQQRTLHECLHELSFHHAIDVSDGNPRRLRIAAGVLPLARVLFERLPAEAQRAARHRLLEHYARVLGQLGGQFSRGNDLAAREGWRRESACLSLVTQACPLPEVPSLRRAFVDAAWAAHALLCKLLGAELQRPFFERCAAAARELGEPMLEGRLLGIIASLEQRDGEAVSSKAHGTAAIQLFVNAVDNYEAQPDTWAPMDTLGQVAVICGDVEGGVKIMEKVAFLKERTRGRGDTALADKHFENAELLYHKGEPALALKLYLHCLRARVAAHDGEKAADVAAVLLNMAVIEKGRGNQFEAFALYERYQQIQQSVGFEAGDIAALKRTRLLPGYNTILM
eukprot:g2682.t1